MTALLPTGDQRDDRRIEKAIAHVERSKDERYWTADGGALTTNGKKVFDADKKAIRELEKVDGVDVSDRDRYEVVLCGSTTCPADRLQWEVQAIAPGKTTITAEDREGRCT